MSEVILPDELLIQCPMLGKLKRVSVCSKCEHIEGVIKHDIRTTDENISPTKLYSIACKHPRLLPLSELEE